MLNQISMNNPKRPEETEVIWRYIGLDKLIDLLLTKSIKFSQVKIAADQNELTLPLSSIEEKHLKSAQKFIEEMRSIMYISCWSLKPHESRSLWYAYLDKTLLGVAIKTNVGSLINSISWNQYSFDYRIVDYRNSFNPEEIQNNIITVNTKSVAYEEETEVRFSISALSNISSESPDEYAKRFLDFTNRLNELEPVISLDIDLPTLNSEIYVSPYCADWQKKSIKDLIKKLCPELTNRIVDSRINERI